MLQQDSKFDLHIIHLIGKVLKAKYVLKQYTYRFSLPVQKHLELFDILIGSVLTYGCEYWGFEKAEEIERLHIQYLKNLLELRQLTPNVMVYLVSGRLPLIYIRYLRIIKYWLKLKDPGNSNILSASILTQMSQSNVSFSWLDNIKSLLTSLGL